MIFLVFIIPKGFSQDKQNFLKGIVVNDSIPVENIAITNKNLKLSTGTNEFGVFEIPVRLGDSILISAIHIKDVLLFVNQEILNRGGVEVAVISKVNQIDAVVLNNMLSKPALDFSAAYMPTTNPDFKTMRRNEIRNLANTDPTRSASVGGGGANILGGISLLSKLLKKKKKEEPTTPVEKLQRWERFKVDFLKQYGTSFFTNDLKIPKLVIDEFLFYCKRDKDIALMYYNNQELELLDFFVKKSKAYRRVNGIE
ncbi:hypothetical protein [Wenyingzhuangia sp. IMCC45467]